MRRWLDLLGRGRGRVCLGPLRRRPLPEDCTSGRCEDGLCASCSDGRKSGSETDTDCGGPCAKVCARFCFDKCVRDSDCVDVYGFLYRSAKCVRGRCICQSDSDCVSGKRWYLGGCSTSCVGHPGICSPELPVCNPTTGYCECTPTSCGGGRYCEDGFCKCHNDSECYGHSAINTCYDGQCGCSGSCASIGIFANTTPVCEPLPPLE
ncbi:MAG: hypothetical protein ACOX6T_22215 [Myxococcales bacterium]